MVEHGAVGLVNVVAVWLAFCAGLWCRTEPTPAAVYHELAPRVGALVDSVDRLAVAVEGGSTLAAPSHVTTTTAAPCSLPRPADFDFRTLLGLLGTFLLGISIALSATSCCNRRPAPTPGILRLKSY